MSTQITGYKHLGKTERLEIEILWGKGHKQADIAKALGRDKGTISREIGRNGLRLRGKPKEKILTKRGGEKDEGRKNRGASRRLYNAAGAEHKKYVRRWLVKYTGKKIREHTEMLAYIVQGLKRHESPDIISGRMRLEEQPFYASKTAIYDFLHSAAGQKYCRYLPSKRYKAKKQGAKKTPREMIPERTDIAERSSCVNERLEYGHFEEDTIVSGKRAHSKAALAVLRERTARYVKISSLPDLKPAGHIQAVIQLASPIQTVKSCTFDNGLENRHHVNLTAARGTQTFFCTPYSAWQKGGVEHQNKQLRDYFPKGSDLAEFSPRYVQSVEDTLNNRPRKSLGYLTPREVMILAKLLPGELPKEMQAHQPEYLLSLVQKPNKKAAGQTDKTLT